MRCAVAVLLLTAACGRIFPPASPSSTEPVPKPVAAATEPREEKREPVGIATRDLEDRGRRLATTIWYPAAPGTDEEEIVWDGIFPQTAAWHAPLRDLPRRFPVVLLSHGSGGDGSNLGWLAEVLASHGYLAIAVDHPGDRFGDVTVEGKFAVWRRPPDLSAALTRLTADPVFGPRLDRRRVAAAGHSSGGTTVLLLAGARIDPVQYLRWCATAGPQPDCGLVAEVDLAAIPDLAAGSASYRDSRIRAAVALAPVMGPGAITRSLRRITIPVLVIASPADELVPFAPNAAHYAQSIPRARLMTVQDAGHFVFLPVCNVPGRLVAAEVCVDRGHDVDRAAVHAQVAESVRAFLDRALAYREPRRAASASSRRRSASGGSTAER